MKLLYIVPKIKNVGGVARVLAIKANYFVENFGYEVHVLSQNEEKNEPFYSFNKKIIFHNVNLSSNICSILWSLRKTINQKIDNIKPDIIVVADNGLKAFIYPFIISVKTPLVFECHGSKYVEEKAQKTSFLLKLKYKFKNFGASRFTYMVALSTESSKEWNVKNTIIIANPSWIKTDSKASLESKKVISIARNSYEKGLDRLLLIWKIISPKYPDWTLDIYTDDIVSLEKEARNIGIISTINYFNFSTNIEEKYVEFSIYLMTSRSEGFPMVLLEAMAFGLPCIAYDCRIGPRSIIKKDKTGFLIPDENIEQYVEKLSLLIENKEQRLELGANAIENMKNFSLHKIMSQWRVFLEGL
ncbi:glycosyltransferase [Flavobacterium geliluteum]|uniref:Glycosyltransferase n=1 Tax=Flavobacterium geliluteum TaxID=2816120 RepID=A0A940X8M0_9FLAO|nr:glycosyltransferase [Flavobacterium geliluteum]MBP4137572.1 glycosyltransferase [Flavobacterium geliluteum]